MTITTLTAQTLSTCVKLVKHADPAGVCAVMTNSIMEVAVPLGVLYKVRFRFFSTGIADYFQFYIEPTVNVMIHIMH